MTRAAVIAGVCTMLFATAARADDAPSPWAVSLEAGARWHVDPAWDAVTSGEAVPFGGVSVARDLTRGRLVLALDAGYTFAAGGRRVYQTWNTSLHEHAMQAGLSLRWRVLSWLAPYARLTAGAMYTTARFDADTTALDADGWTPLGGAGLGVTVQTPGIFASGGDRVGRLAFSVEAGMLLAPSQTLTVSPRPPTDESLADDRLPTTGTRLGALNASAPYLRFAASLRF